MVIPNIVTKFQNFDIFEHLVTFSIVVCSRLPRGLKIRVPHLSDRNVLLGSDTVYFMGRLNLELVHRFCVRVNIY